MTRIDQSVIDLAPINPTAPHVEDLVAFIGSDDFGAAFFSMFDRLFGIDHCTVFISSGTDPRACVAEARSPRAALHVKTLADTYAGSSFATCPIWQRVTELSKEQHRTFLLVPQDLDDLAYRHEYYIRPNIRQELAVTGALDGDRIYAAFYRENGREAFPTQALEWMERSGRLILRIVQKHSHCMSQRPGPAAPAAPTREQLFESVRAALTRDDRSITPREAEICAAIVLGYTVLGISMNLGISVNTVATHRKRAYAKLQISSQNELFARYFRLVEHAIERPRPN